MEYKSYYFVDGEPRKAKNNYHAESLKQKGIKLYAKEEAQLIYTSRQEELKRASKKLEEKNTVKVVKKPKQED